MSASGALKPTVVFLGKKSEWKSPNIGSFHEPLRAAQGFSNSKLMSSKVATTKPETKNKEGKENVQKCVFDSCANSFASAESKATTTANSRTGIQSLLKKEGDENQAKFSNDKKADVQTHHPFSIKSSFGEKNGIIGKQAPSLWSSHKTAWLSTPEQKKSMTEWRDRSEIKPKQESRIKALSICPDSDQELMALNQKLQFNQKLINSVKLDCLPDKGAKITSQIVDLENRIGKLQLDNKTQDASKSIQNCKMEKAQPNIVTIKPQTTQTKMPTQRQTKLTNYMSGFQPNHLPFSEQPTLYGGTMSKGRLNKVQSVMQDAVEKIHRSLQSCPSSSSEESDPVLLKTKLMPHQRQALSWLMWREKQDPPGGILADDMGLGKTLTMISLILKSKETTADQKELNSLGWFTKPGTGTVRSSKATLVVCPTSLLHQWAQEISTHCQQLALSVLIYHGASRERLAQKIANHDVVITTYGTLTKEVGIKSASKDTDSPIAQKKVSAQDSCFLRITWQRIILDEAHSIKNPKSLSNQCLCQLRADHRWALTGTPIHNKLLDMYALLRFLRCTPFDELKVWKKWVDNSSEQGTYRLNTLMNSLMLRRTKDQKNSQGMPLVSLPPKNVETHTLKATDKEMIIHDNLLNYCRSAIKELLKNHRERAKSADLPQGQTMSHTLILVLLLRLQQCCGHLGLLKKAPVTTESSEDEDLLIRQMEDLTIDKKRFSHKDILNILSEYKDDEEFLDSFPSTKIFALLSHLDSIKSESTNKERTEKCVIVSQWTSMLRIIGFHLKKNGYRYHLIQGDVKPEERMKAVDDFNKNPRGAEVMMLSLKAGGVGLNLVGGCHLFIMDLHWNPALESQACDRIYRVGQRHNVFIHKFVCQGTIEDRILTIQENKASLAKNVLEGGENANKLTWNDMKMLFDLR